MSAKGTDTNGAFFTACLVMLLLVLAAGTALVGLVIGVIVVRLAR